MSARCLDHIPTSQFVVTRRCDNVEPVSAKTGSCTWTKNVCPALARLMASAGACLPPGRNHQVRPWRLQLTAIRVGGTPGIKPQLGW